MVLLAPPAGNKIYLASSIRHLAGRQIYTQSPVKMYLEQCVHRTDGRCAEFNVVEACFEDNPSAEKCSLEGSKIVCWVRPTRGSTIALEVTGSLAVQNLLKNSGSAPSSPLGHGLRNRRDWQFSTFNRRNIIFKPSPPGSQG